MGKKKVDYNIGLDIGVSSVGWAVTDSNYKLLKKGNKNLWGSRLFDGTEGAKNRRIQRSTRRRYNKRRERIRLLKEAMSDLVLNIDPSFYHRLDKTTFLDKEDKEKMLGDNYKAHYNLFVGNELTDKIFYKKYKTIYHLRYELATSKERADPRLIYLALHHIIKYRGNFLYEGQNFDFNNKNIKEELLELLCFIAERNHISVSWDDKIDELIEIMKKTLSKNNRVSQCLDIINDKKNKDLWKYIFNGFLGLKCNFNKIIDENILINEKGIEFNFSDSNYEQVFENIETELDDELLDIILKMKTESKT